MNNKNIIKDLFINVFENKNFRIEDISNFVSPDYVQYLDGKILNYAQFVEHVELLRSKIKNCRVEFKTLIAEDDIIFSNHTIAIELQDGHKAKMQVMAEFHLREGKLFYSDEVTHLIESTSEQRDQGSVVS